MDKLVSNVGFEIIGEELAEDMEVSLQKALDLGAVFPSESDPLSIFRGSLEESIHSIETNSRSVLFERFLRDGPYEDSGGIPPEIASKYLSDEEAAAAIRFIYYRVINHFQGCLAELLAVEPCMHLLKRLQNDGMLPPDAEIYVGDTIAIGVSNGTGFAKGADMHMLIFKRLIEKIDTVMVAGVVEVKSYPVSQTRVLKQSRSHIRRVGYGMRVQNRIYGPTQVHIGGDNGHIPFKIVVVPASWALPRTFRFEGPSLIVDTAVATNRDTRIVSTGINEYRITLKWSHEALAEAAYEMTFWYMGKKGEKIFKDGVPKEWSEMTLAEAGQNAIKMMLYYAILRSRTRWENQRAVALYNTYGFGYSLGMNFRDESGLREMLWPEDLREIMKSGKTKHGCRLVK